MQDHQQKEIKVHSKRFKLKSDFPFPTRHAGKKLQSCQANGFEKFSGLHYRESLESVLCFVSMKNEKLSNLKKMKDTRMMPTLRLQ